jgi:phage gpG-like protein
VRLVAEFLRVETSGSAELQTYLTDAVRRVGKPRELMQVLAARLEANIQERFDTKRDPDGSPWAPLSPATLAMYERIDTVRSGRNAGQVRKRGSILERTRQMRQSLTSNASDNTAQVGMSRETDGGKWSIPLLHETGTERMPRRGMFFSDPDTGALGAGDEAMLSEEITAFLQDVFDK